MSKTNLPPTGPLRDPPGWCSLRDAFVYFGKAAIGPGFPVLPRGEMEAAMDQTFVGSAELAPDGKPVCGDRELASVYYFSVGLCLSSAIRSGRIASAYCEKGGGAPKPMDLGWWITDHPMLRYQTWCVDPAKPFSRETELPCWVFLRWSDLHSVFEELGAWRNSLPDFRDIEDPIDGVDRTDCYTGRLAVCLLDSPDPGIWFSSPWLPDYERPSDALVPDAANDPHPGSNVVALGSMTADAAGDGAQPARQKRRPGRKLNPVWAKAYARVYRNHRSIALSLSDVDFRKWIIDMSALKEQATPNHHETIRNYRDRAERGEFDALLDGK